MIDSEEIRALAESWENGNRGHVVGFILDMPKEEAVASAVGVARHLSANDVEVFERALIRRAG